MAIDKDKIKQALDSFEAEDFITSKEILQQELKNAKNDYLATKLNLTAPAPAQPAPEQE